MSFTTTLDWVFDALGLITNGRIAIQSGGFLDVENGGELRLAGTAITSNAAEINELDAMTTGWSNDIPGSVDFTVNAIAGDKITVNVQLNDIKGNALGERTLVRAYLSDVATGISVTATAPDTDFTTETDGDILSEITADKDLWVWSEADGDIDLSVEDTGADTWYLAIVDPLGQLHVSGAITIA